MYPIMSPGTMEVSIGLQGKDGSSLARIPMGSLTSPGSRFVEVSIESLAKEKGVSPDELGTFTVRADSPQGTMPPRVNHQLVYSRGGLESSINVSLLNPDIFKPAGKKGLTWGQLVLDRSRRSMLAFSGNTPGHPADQIEITFYGEQGKLGKLTRPLPSDGAAMIDPLKDFNRDWLDPKAESPEYIWYMARSANQNLTGYSVSCDETSLQCSGEHSF